MFNKKQRIGEIATIFPKATNIFMKYEIDFCCGGDRPLEEALKKQGIDENKIIDEINNEYEKFKETMGSEIDWRSEKMSDLIDFVINKHHAFLKEELPITAQYLNKILQVHYEHNGELLSKLNKLFNALKVELEEHLVKEEVLLFPLIKEYENNPSKETLEKAIKVMNETESEHDAAGDIIKEMRRITEGFKLPENVCRTFEITYEKIEAIESDLFHHIHLENNILFEKIKNI
jgi:regulator of cell morphogenesis and NO signaling